MRGTGVVYQTVRGADTKTGAVYQTNPLTWLEVQRHDQSLSVRVPQKVLASRKDRQQLEAQTGSPQREQVLCVCTVRDPAGIVNYCSRKLRSVSNARLFLKMAVDIASRTHSAGVDGRQAGRDGGGKRRWREKSLCHPIPAYPSRQKVDGPVSLITGGHR